MIGLSGHISFDRGIRQHFSLDVLQLQGKKVRKVGKWSTAYGLNMSIINEPQRRRLIFLNKTLLVTSIKEAPYMMESAHFAKTEQKYEGFCVDMLNEIADKAGFQYSIELVPDGKYGAPDKGGNWNGMVRQLMDKKADLAVASLTINYIREQVIDFTKPFMNLGISILFKRPRRESPGLFSFLNPLAPEIWFYVIVAYFTVSLLLYLVARFSPYEWHNTRPCDSVNLVLENVFSLSNSFWFVVGTLMQQGSDINPRAISTRIVGGMWWFFTLIIISSYTANLAAFLTVERMLTPIESAEDLAKQTTILYGTIAGGSTMTFFRESTIPTYQAMWNFMEIVQEQSMSRGEPGVFMKTTQEGIDKVLKGDYAFLMESTMIDYNIQRNCELMQVGGLLDSKGYGIGTQINSPLRDPITMAILELQENGRIQMLYNKWWRNAGTCTSDDKTKEKKAHSLGVANVGGIFVVLLFGLAMAIMMGILEFIWHHFVHTSEAERQEKQSIWSVMLEELRFAIRIRGTSKRLRVNSRCSRCSYHLPPQLPSVSTCLSRMTEIKMVAASSISSCISAGLELGELPHKLNQNVDDGNDQVFCENV